MHAIFSPRRGLKKGQATCEMLVISHQLCTLVGLMHFWLVLNVARTVKELIQTSGETKKKKTSTKKRIYLNACLQADGQLYEAIRDQNNLNHHKI